MNATVWVLSVVHYGGWVEPSMEYIIWWHDRADAEKAFTAEKAGMAGTNSIVRLTEVEVPYPRRCGINDTITAWLDRNPNLYIYLPGGGSLPAARTALLQGVTE